MALLGLDLHVRADLLQAADDDPFVRLQPFWITRRPSS